MAGRTGEWRSPMVGVTVGSILLAAALGAPSASASAEPPLAGEMIAFEPANPPQPAPDLSVTDASGNSVSLVDLEGRLLLVNFWATWCAPCVYEMPSLDRLQAARGDQPFEVVAISLDRGGLAVVEPFYERLSLSHLAVYLDPQGRMARDYGVRAFPTSVLIDGQGRELGRLAGPAEWDQPDALDLIDHYLRQGG